jgi:hypothetical protein
LQKLLNGELSPRQQILEDGVFGTGTEKAVKVIQYRFFLVCSTKRSHQLLNLAISLESHERYSKLTSKTSITTAVLNLYPKFSVAIATIALGATAIATSQAQSSIVTYDFTVNVTQGSLAGQSYSGTFSYDDSTLKGTGAGLTQLAQRERSNSTYALFVSQN